MSDTSDIKDALPAQLRKVRALCFDFIGTCFDWHSPVKACLEAHGSEASLQDVNWSRFAHLWRSLFFALVKDLNERDEVMPVTDVYRLTLRNAMQEHNVSELVWDEKIQDDLIRSWGMMDAWADTVNGIRCLRSKLSLAVLSNGSTMATISINKRSGVEWDLLLNSNIIGAYKPHPKMYQAALQAFDATRSPNEVAMVAAHVYDLEAAKTHGMRTIYIKRSTEDTDIDISQYNFDLVINEGGIVELARRLSCIM